MSLIRCFFDTVSREWDHKAQPDPSLLDFLLGKLTLQPGKTVLDAGTGTGVLIPYLNRKTAYAAIDAVDLSAGMLEVARRKYGRHSNVRFIEEDIESYPKDTKYDNIVLFSVFPHLRRPVETITRLQANNLNRGGRLLIAHAQGRGFLNEMHRRKADCVCRDMLLPVDEQRELFESAGLRVAEADESDSFYYLLLQAESL